MATGIPRRSRTKRDDDSAPLFELAYKGKVPTAEVLASKPVVLNRAWPQDTETKNGKRLYFSENKDVLASLLHDKTVRGKVKLVYIDPPFSTETIFHSRTMKHAYEDVLYGADFIEFLRQRIILLRELMSEDASFYLHLDGKMVFHAKLILDEIFGSSNFRNMITRKKCNPKNYTKNQYGNVSDYILFYSKSNEYDWNRQVEVWTPERAREYQYVEPETGRRFMKVPVHAPGIRNGETGQPWRGKLPPPGKHWQFTPTVLDEIDARGEMFWSSNGNPRRKVYLDENPGVGVQDIWLEFKDAHNQNVKITGYPTEKNPELLRRIIEASSNAGDLVLDCFSGSGTTLAVADVLGRRWIGVDSSPEAIRTTLTRFANGLERMGDFVKGRSGKKRALPSLFAELPDSGHTPIRDFELWMHPAATEATSLAREAAQLLGLSSLQAAE